MHRVLLAVSLLQIASALLHSHAKPKVEQEKYAYVTMKFVYGKTIGSKWMEMNREVMENTMNDTELEEEAHSLFDPERAAHLLKKARSFKKVTMEQGLATELDGSLPCYKRDPGRQVSRLAAQLDGVNAKYPLVVYTNDECLLNISSTLPKNIILESNFKYLPRHCAMNAKNSMHFNKMGVFGLTGYKKMMWMDWDLQLKENIDDLFEKDTNNGNTVYGQRDDWKCTGKADETKLWDSASGGFCSGLMLFEPKKTVVDDLIENQGKLCWGDQVVIAKTFSKKQNNGRSWKVWDNDVISFRPCQRKFKPRVVHHADLPNSDPGAFWK